MTLFSLKRISLLGLLLFTWLGANPVMAAYITVNSEQTIEESDERKARSKAIDQATNAVTQEMVKREIGDVRFAENKAKVDSDVMPLKNRFIPFFKIVSSKRNGENFIFNIEVKVSRQDLRHVLQQKGLFASGEKTGITIPFVVFNNQISGESFRWWAPGISVSKNLESLSLVFEKELFDGFIEKGLFLLKPQTFNMEHMLPGFLQKTFLTQTEMIQISNLKQGQLFIEGSVDLVPSPIRENAYRVRVQLSCKQTSNGKSVAEVVRSYDTPQGQQLNQISGKVKQLGEESGRELANQVYDLWQRGALEAQVLQLSVTGDLNHQQLLRFKKELSNKMGLSNGLTERLFEPGRVTFEMDYSGGVDSLSQKLKNTQLDGFMSQVVSSNAEGIILDVKVAQ